MNKIRVKLKERSYDILIGPSLIKKAGSLIRRLDIGKDAVVITNKKLLSLYKKPLENSLTASGFTVRFEAVPDSERAKAASIATNVIDRISKYDKLKSIFIIAFGGGVIGDLAGFVAAVYKRGIPYVQFPTTLLAQVDSAIGGKVAVDLPIAKNLIGAFYQPRLVISDTSLIKSLSPRQISSGLGEVIKYGVIKDRELFEFLESDYKKVLKADPSSLEYIVSRASRIKAAVVSKDEFDSKGIRAVLNFGHTIGHAVEAASGYSARYNHGEAIAIGMVIASDISCRMGMMKASELARIENLVKRLGLPADIKGLKFSSIYESHLHDKKFLHGRNRLILPVGIGRVKVVEDVPDGIIIEAIKNHLRGGM